MGSLRTVLTVRSSYPPDGAASTVDRVERLRPYPVAVFCGVTLLIWTNRIWLAWTNDEDTVVADRHITSLLGFIRLGADAFLPQRV